MKWNGRSRALLSGLLLAVACTVAQATPISVTWDPVDVLLTAPESGATGVATYEYSHTFSYDPTHQDIFSPLLTLYLYDDGGSGDGTEKYWLVVDKEDLGQTLNLTGQSGTPGEFSIATSALSDGRLDVSITASAGDFWFGRSVFTADVSERVTAPVGGAGFTDPPSTLNASTVPEPGSLLLLGSGLLGLAAVGRRMKG